MCICMYICTYVDTHTHIALIFNVYIMYMYMCVYIDLDSYIYCVFFFKFFILTCEEHGFLSYRIT
jgi:hypothetical protein